MRRVMTKGWAWAAFVVVLVLALATVWACAAPKPATTTPAAPATGTLSGTVTNTMNKAPVAGVSLAFVPAVQAKPVTDASGAFTVDVPTGIYEVSFSKTGFAALKQNMIVVAGQKTTSNVTLKPNAPVLVSIGAVKPAAPGASVNLAATVESFDGSQVTGYEWKQVSGPPAKIASATSATTSATLAGAAESKTYMMKTIELENRFSVQALDPHVVSGAKTAVFRVTATTSSGKYSATTNVAIDLPYQITTGLANVPVGVPVVIHGKNQNAYSWTLIPAANSKAALDSASDQDPAFTPDVPGKYTLTEKNSNVSINVYAGTYAGAITGKDDKGLPLTAACSTCHNGKIAPDNFTDWRKSGHAEIFTTQINTSTHYSESCLLCHTVGFDKGAKNGGIDEADDYAAFFQADLFHKVGPNNWTTILSKFPKTASLANIQCDNCHGPTQSVLHANGKIDPERISISADVCASCHAEPPRHGRFQQWEESGHGDFDPAIIEATVEMRAGTAAHCGRCHSTQGFLKWIAQGDLTKLIQGAKGNATVDELRSWGLTADQVQPVTCVACHDPHNPGSASGEPNTATVRISGNTPKLPAGFAVVAAGRGAICMTCHNTRNGLHNDAVPPNNYSAPHTAAQTDVLMGQNAYFVAVGNRTSHSWIEDTCATCHMEKSPPPAEFSYQLSGTNHAFEASITSCGECHTKAVSGEALKESHEEELHELGAAMAAYLTKKLPVQFTILDYTPHKYNNKDYDLKSAPVVIDKTNIASIEPTEPHGQQGFLFKFKNPVSLTYKPATGETHTVQVTEAEVQLGDITTDGKIQVIPLTDPLVKAGWNYFLIHGDGSGGIHNPTFTFNVIKASIAALK
ncbi:MAG: carboxypeptidase regulatory-like domain-containing protein [Chloroflexota bacterium]